MGRLAKSKEVSISPSVFLSVPEPGVATRVHIAGCTIWIGTRANEGLCDARSVLFRGLFFKSLILINM